jgi:hypothetical protein
MKFTLITVATEETGYYEVLKETAKTHDYELITLGLGEPWTGYTMKYQLMKDYLDRRTIDPTSEEEIIVFLDGYDTFVLNDVKLLQSRYESFEKPLVFGSQWNRKHGDKLSHFVIKTFSSGFDVIMNSGSYMGPVWVLKEKFEMLCSLFDCDITSQNDQKLLNKARKLKPAFFDEYVAIDKDGVVFHNAAYRSSIHYTYLLKKCSWFNDIEIDKIDGKLLIRDTDIEPVFLSGPGNVDLVPYVKYKYGDDVTDLIIKRTDYGKEFYKEFIPELFTYYGILIIIIITIVLCIYNILKLFI